MALFFAILAACAQAPGQDERPGLTLNLPSNRMSRGAYAYEAVRIWRIAGTSAGPGFAQDFPGTATSARITDVYPGEWVIKVDGLDAAGTALFTAKQTVTLVEGVNAVTMTMTPVIIIPSSNADLASIALSSGSISPTFSASVLEYVAYVPYSGSPLTVTATPASAKATVVYSVTMPMALAIGSNALSITVTAEDKTTSKAYTVAITRLGPPDISVQGKLNYYDSVPVTLMSGNTINFGVIDSMVPAPVTMAFTIRNNGASDLHPVLTIANATDPNAFSLPVPTAPPVIPGGTYSFDIVYSPPGSYFPTLTGTLTISSDDPDTSAFILNLTGTFC